jgi:hypothetical protein
VSKLEKSLLKNGSDINLRHFIYLDRTRLTSYSSQLSDGVIQLRRLTENKGNRLVDNPSERVRESFREIATDGEVKLGFAAGKKTNKRNSKTTLKESGVTSTDEYFQSFSEDKTDYDNTYITFEKQLIQSGSLSEITEDMVLEDYTPLIKTSGVSRFFDWDSMVKVFNSTCDFSNVINQINSGDNDNDLTSQIEVFRFLMEVVNTFSIGPITLHTHVGQLSLLASLNPEHLCVTRDQLRAIYVMPGDVEITLVGFTPERTLQPTAFPGIAGTVDMAELWQNLVGQVDLVIDPIAVYAETHLKL